MRVSFHALLTGIDEHDQQYYCMKEEWDFGDGAVSSESNQCPPFSFDTKITTEFFVEHLYNNVGNYTIYFTLGDHRIRSNNTTVNVVASRTPTTN